ncbi:hypothetical protein [Mycolicibacterium sp. YH-1]|uniref:hypothetical protein n=1 Tax=Mycolicibacterium sp. YH-1 TaxID=2908837 RepID=UPI001F4C3DDE|nr:hypothetical protein [Mycolicibacterium sp. YH-1]UNB54846.1 hypothetical protein L0M16_11310 [Mycolicibacterium sp. YH-1]
MITYAHLENGRVEGDVLVCDGGDLTMTGMITGTLTVGRGGYALMCGTVGNLVVRDAGGAQLDGWCNGDARNDGGELKIARNARVDGSTYGYVSTV